MCDQGPAMLINEKVYTNLDPETAVKIINEIK
jgi:NADH:ubiquinone oxidoreductase subunit E